MESIATARGRPHNLRRDHDTHELRNTEGQSTWDPTRPEGTQETKLHVTQRPESLGGSGHRNSPWVLGVTGAEGSVGWRGTDKRTEAQARSHCFHESQCARARGVPKVTAPHGTFLCAEHHTRNLEVPTFTFTSASTPSSVI